MPLNSLNNHSFIQQKFPEYIVALCEALWGNKRKYKTSFLISKTFQPS